MQQAPFDHIRAASFGALLQLDKGGRNNTANPSLQPIDAGGGQLAWAAQPSLPSCG